MYISFNELSLLNSFDVHNGPKAAEFIKVGWDSSSLCCFLNEDRLKTIACN